jgi:hypothetical protein
MSREAALALATWTILITNILVTLLSSTETLFLLEHPLVN